MDLDGLDKLAAQLSGDKRIIILTNKFTCRDRIQEILRK
jgi:hypothetical protein